MSNRPFDPPPGFFEALEADYLDAVRRLARDGFRLVGFETWPDLLERGWADLRSVRVIGRNDRGEERRILFDVRQPELFKKPVRRVRTSSDELIVRVNRGIELEFPQGDPVRKDLERAFTYDNPEWKKKRRLGFSTHDTPARIVSYEADGNQLIIPRGGTDKVREVLKSHGRWPPRIRDERLLLDPFELETGPDADPALMREDQERLIAALLDKENCLLRAATGAGKTEVIIEAIRRIRQPTLIIVWSAGLLEQWRERICLRFGWRPRDVGVLGGGKSVLRPITIAMQQTLVKRAPEVAGSFGMLVGDEVQRWAARTFREVIGHFPARYRVGVSADERRKDRMDFLIRDHFGQVAATVDKKELIREGKLCPVEFILVPTELRISELDQASPQVRGELVGQMWNRILDRIAANEPRNRRIADLAATEVKSGASVIVFTDRVEHAQDLRRRLVVHHQVPTGLCLGGAENRASFEEACDRLRTGDLRCAVATKVMYQGTDIPRLSVGIVASPTATNDKLLEQQVGRLRRPFKGKTKGRMYYILDQNIFGSHAQAIRRLYGKDLVSWIGDE